MIRSVTSHVTAVLSYVIPVGVGMVCLHAAVIRVQAVVALWRCVLIHTGRSRVGLRVSCLLSVLVLCLRAVLFVMF